MFTRFTFQGFTTDSVSRWWLVSGGEKVLQPTDVVANPCSGGITVAHHYRLKKIFEGSAPRASVRLGEAGFQNVK